MFQLRQSFLLFLTATIWGSGFVAQSIGMDHVTPFTYTFFRTFIGAIVLLPVIYWLHQRKRSDQKQSERPAPHYQRKDLIIGSICCGICLVGGESFQQFGLVTTDAGKAGFITSLYIVFVPIFGLFLGKKLNRFIILGVLLSLFGFYLLCIKQSFTIEQGDVLILICAVVFAFHILVIAYYVERIDGVELSCGQFLVASFLGLVLMLIFDHNLTWENFKAALPAMLWCGIMSNGVAYTLQIVGQRGINPTIATIILSMESVMAVFFGWLILDESLSVRQYIGCAVMFAAVIIAQLNPRIFLREK